MSYFKAGEFVVHKDKYIHGIKEELMGVLHITEAERDNFVYISGLPYNLKRFEYPTVKWLRQHGYKVRVMHIRKTIVNVNYSHETEFLPPSITTSEKLSACGGRTVIELTKNGVTVVGESVCRYDENYNKKIGAHFAIQRALKALNETQRIDPNIVSNLEPPTNCVTFEVRWTL